MRDALRQSSGALGRLAGFFGFALLICAAVAWPQGPTPHDITLTWQASAGATGYKVYCATTAGGPYTAIGTAAALTFKDASGIGGTKYFYVLTATNTNRESGTSNQVNATFSANPAAPAGLQAVAN